VWLPSEHTGPGHARPGAAVSPSCLIPAAQPSLPLLAQSGPAPLPARPGL